MIYLKFKRYKKLDFLKLKDNDILCIVDNQCINTEIFFTAIIKKESNKIIDIVNEYTHENIYNISNTNELNHFINNRELAFITNKAYCFILQGNNDIKEIINFFKNVFVFKYIKYVICNGNIKLNKLKIPLNILPETFTKPLTNKYILYCEQNYNNDLNTKINNRYVKLGILVTILLGFNNLIPYKYIEIIWDKIFELLNIL